MGKKAKNFRAWLYQNPNGTIEDAWNAAWEGQNALQYSRTIQRLEADVNAMKGIANTQAEIIGEQNEEIERLKELLIRVQVMEGRCPTSLMEAIRTALAPDAPVNQSLTTREPRD